MVKIHRVKQLRCKHRRDVGGMNAPAAKALKCKDWNPKWGKNDIAIAETRKSKVRPTIEHEVRERNLMQKMGPPTLKKYFTAHNRVTAEEKKKERKK